MLRLRPAWRILPPHPLPHPPATHPTLTRCAVKQKFIKFNQVGVCGREVGCACCPMPACLHLYPQLRTLHTLVQLGLKDNVAQLVVFQRRGAGGSKGEAGSRTSSEGSAGSLSGQKRRQGEEVAPRSRHLRFDSSGEEEGGPPGLAKRHSADQPSAAAAAAAVQAVSIEDAVVGMEHDASASSLDAAAGGSAGQAVEAATEPADAAEAAGDVQQQRLPELLVANIHVLFSPKRGDLKLGQVRVCAAAPLPPFCDGCASSCCGHQHAAAEAVQRGMLPWCTACLLPALGRPTTATACGPPYPAALAAALTAAAAAPAALQVRTLMEHVDSLCLQRQKRSGRRAAAVVCGDFNSAAGAVGRAWHACGQCASRGCRQGMAQLVSDLLPLLPHPPLSARLRPSPPPQARPSTTSCAAGRWTWPSTTGAR